MFWVGILQALAITLLLTFYNVIVRVAVQEYHIQPLVFTCMTLMISAFILSLLAGPGRLVRETLKSTATWVYSCILVATYVADVYVMHYVTATEASFLSRMTIPLSIIVAFVMLNRKPKVADLFGVGIVMLGLGILLAIQPTNILLPLLVVAGVSALCQTMQFFIAETHAEAVVAHKSGSIRDKARVVGFVTFVTSGVFLAITLLLSLIDRYSGLDITRYVSVVPQLEDFIHPATIWAAMLYGVLFLPFMRYFKWAAAYNIKSENLIMFLAFVPVTTLMLEGVVSFSGSYSFNHDALAGERGLLLLMVALMMTFGAGLTAFLRMRAELAALPKGMTVWQGLKQAMMPKNTGLAIQHSHTAVDDYEIICAALEYTAGDERKAALLLGISEQTLMVLQEGKGSFALVEEESLKMARRYRHNIANCDALTGLLNRGGFRAELKQRIEASSASVVLMLDLDKFKPVNDDYGHDVGDALLRMVGERLKSMFDKSAIVARLGGDEFAVLLPVAIKDLRGDVRQQIADEMAKEFVIDGRSVYIGASVGVASYPTDGNDADALLKVADDAMYVAKREYGR